MSIRENLLDVCQLQWCASDPHVQKILRKYLLPKRPKDPLPEKVINLLATPHVLKEPPVPESDDSDVESEAESEHETQVDEQEMESDSEEESEAESEAESETKSEEDMDQD